MIDKIYCVTNDSGKVKEYFTSRDSAIAFIVDEFSMALLFRNDKEGERLSEYLNANDSTPNQYPYKYSISAIKINNEYNM